MPWSAPRHHLPGQSTTRSLLQLHLHSILLSRYSVPIPSIARCCGSWEFAQYACPCGVPWPRLPFWLAFDRWLDSVLQDYGIDTVSALHTAEGLDVVFTGVMEVVVPLRYEQARTTSAGSRRQLLACRNRLKAGPLSFCVIVPLHPGSVGAVLCAMIQPPGCWFDAMCPWLQRVTVSSILSVTVAQSHDRTMNGQ